LTCIGSNKSVNGRQTPITQSLAVTGFAAQ